MSDTFDYGVCDCCKNEPAVGVAAVPGVPMSIAWGINCLNANIVPYDIAVYKTALVGSIDQAAEWWKELVDNTLKYFSVPRDKFIADVADAASGIEDPQKEPE